MERKEKPTVFSEMSPLPHRVKVGGAQGPLDEARVKSLRARELGRGRGESAIGSAQVVDQRAHSLQLQRRLFLKK